MDVQFHGANCLSISTKQARITVDDNLNDIGGKSVAKPDDIILFTGAHSGAPGDAKLVVNQPGEYEISGISIYGVAARSHLEEGGKSATMYKIIADDIDMLVVGHIYPELSDAQLEAIGMVDVMFIPVGGNGYTLDPIGALKLIKKVGPKIVIPTHYESKKLQFAVPQQPLDQALKALAMEPADTLPKFKPKGEDLVEGALKLIVLEEV